jgi:hypothetical protein
MILLTTLIAILLTFAGFALIVSSVKAHWQVSRRCSHCGYDLHTHRPGERCPECGRTIGEFPDGYIERRPDRLVLGLVILTLALVAFGAMAVLMLRTVR